MTSPNHQPGEGANLQFFLYASAELLCDFQCPGLKGGKKKKKGRGVPTQAQN